MVVMDKEFVRLSKILSERGVCSRREADRLIEAGQVRVDGEIISTLGQKVSPQSEIQLLPSAQKEQREKVTILLNKPVGIVSAQPEKDYIAAIELITAQNQELGISGLRFQPLHRKKLAVAGRLDIDSKGLLVFTQDGVIAKQLIGQDSGVEKEYLVWVQGTITESILDKLRFGLSLDGARLKRAKVEKLLENRLRIILKEGKKRQIRRMCEMVGLYVTGLKRVRIGNIILGNLTEGCWRYLEPGESFI